MGILLEARTGHLTYLLLGCTHKLRPTRQKRSDGRRGRDGPALEHGVRLNAAFESLAVTADGHVWTANEAPLQQDGPDPAFARSGRVRLLELSPEVVLLGTGDCQRMPPAELYAAFAARGIGLEVMDNRAACRTYNVLLGEYREVAVALML